MHLHIIRFSILLSLFFSALSIAASISNDRMFAFAEGNYPSYFPGTATDQQYLQYNYRYYPSTKTYLAIDTSGVLFLLGPTTQNVITAVGPVTAFADAITAWETTQVATAYRLPPPYIGWEFSPTPAIYTWVMQLCGGGAPCTPLGGSILEDVNPNDTITVSGLANGIRFEDVTSTEFRQIINEETQIINTILFNLWKGSTLPYWAVVESVLNSALASATSPEDLISRIISGFVSAGFPAAVGDTTTVGSTGGAAVGGYQCPTTKAVNDPDWIQSHGSYWAAASAHYAYTTCLKTKAEAACHSYYTLETQYCNYAKPACLAIVTSASDCPG